MATYASMSTNDRTLVIAPGQTKQFTVTFTPPQGLDPASFPVYSGNVLIESATEALSVSYLGVAASMKDMQVLDKVNIALIDRSGQVQNTTATYTFDLEKNDYPTVAYFLKAGSTDVKLDLLDASTSKVFGNLADYPYQSRNTDGDAQTQNGLNTLAWSNATLADGTNVPNGSYSIQVSVSRYTPCLLVYF